MGVLGRGPAPQGIKGSPRRHLQTHTARDRPSGLVGTRSRRTGPGMDDQQPPKRRPGRPRKHPIAQPSTIDQANGTAPHIKAEEGQQQQPPLVEKRKRGRPRKHPAPNPGAAAPDTGVKRPRGTASGAWCGRQGAVWLPTGSTLGTKRLDGRARSSSRPQLLGPPCRAAVLVQAPASSRRRVRRRCAAGRGGRAARAGAGGAGGQCVREAAVRVARCV